MQDYFSLDKQELQLELQRLTAEYERFKGMNLALDMSRGKPDTNQLDLSLGLLQVPDYVDNTGVDARNYGLVEGIPEARAYFAGLLGAATEETMVGGNSSLQMMYTIIEMAWRKGFADSPRPWGCEEKVKFLCPAPGYDRHFRITEDYGFELVLVPMLPTGPDMDRVEELVKDPAVKGMWSIPVYSNPDGYVYSDETVQRLARMQTGAKDFRIFWDNAYLVHHLTDVEYTCPNLLAQCKEAGNANRALMFCSTSKVTFAGGGVSAFAASVANVAGASAYLFNGTIGFDKVNQLRHVRFLQQQGGIREHMKKHAALLAPKFQRVQEILEKELSGLGVAEWTKPKGGYFISFFTPEGCAKRVVQLCKEAGVVLTGAGAAYPYGIDPADRHIRIAPSYPPIEELDLAAQLLCTATRLASAEKLLQA